MGCSIQKNKLPLSQQTINLSDTTQTPSSSQDDTERQQNLNTLKSLLRSSNFSISNVKQTNCRKRAIHLQQL
ncbi:unnamed protein product [Paramecium pentaurelia]|uniref:Uncharacterized protein n=1 Tax=Paramecium pentaurelia TaxID=43138 RepID=A0A8S1SJ03_9CILI|nr:unnamed protein product [Paramecium pentaurelia]CAD8141343.1 unnamed protein product [Paramecium pentaurelia]